jgi:hypothetical protein
VRELADYFDEHKLLVTKAGDGGDTAANTGRWAFLYAAWFSDDHRSFLNLKLAYISAIEKLTVSPGVLVRHPTQWNDPKDLSRDQLRINWMAMGMYDLRPQMNEFFWAHLKRCGKYQNWDFSSPEDISVWIRIYRVWWLWPVLLVTDWFTVLQSIVCWFRLAWNYDDVADCLNHDCVLVQGWLILPTPVTWLARAVNARRPNKWNLGPVGHRIMFPWRWYHREKPTDPIGESPPIDDIARPVLGRVFKFDA